RHSPYADRAPARGRRREDRAVERARGVRAADKAAPASRPLPAGGESRPRPAAPLRERRTHPPAPARLRRVDPLTRSAARGAAQVPGALGRGQGSPRVMTRAEFLERIRERVRMSPGRFEASPAARPRHPAAEAEIVRRELVERWPQTLEAFRREFEGVAGVFHRAATVDMVPAVVAEIARERGARELVTWHAAALGADPGASRGAP